MSKFVVECNGIDIHVLSISIIHVEERLPEVQFTTIDDLTNDGLYSVFLDSIKIAEGKVCKLANSLDRYEFRLIYEQCATPELNIGDYYDPFVERENYYLEYCRAKLKVPNYRLLDGACVESDIIPESYRRINTKQCFSLVSRKLKSTTYCVNAQICAHWRHIAEGSHDVRLNFITYIPFIIQKYWPQRGQMLNANTWVGYSELQCVKTLSKENSGNINFGMELQARLIARWFYDYTVQETVNVHVSNPLSDEVNQTKDIQDIKFNVFPQIENCVFWENNNLYMVGARVYFGYYAYRCIFEHTSNDWFEEQFWEKDLTGSMKEQCYFLSDRGRISLRYIFNCIAGRFIQHSRVNLTELELPIKYLTKMQIGDAINVSNRYGIISKIALICAKGKSKLEVQIKGTDLQPKRVSSVYDTGCIEHVYASEYAATEVNIANSETGLEVSLPLTTNAGLFKTHHHEQLTAINTSDDPAIETFLLRVPTHIKNDYIAHDDLNARWIMHTDKVRIVNEGPEDIS